MLNDIGNGFVLIFGGIVTIAVISVVVGQKSQAPAVIQAASGALSQVIHAAVNPANTNAANPVTNNQSSTSPISAAVGAPNNLGASLAGSAAQFLMGNG